MACDQDHLPIYSCFLTLATGDPGSAFYFLISGRASVVVSNADESAPPDAPRVQKIVNELKAGTSMPLQSRPITITDENRT